MIIHSDELPVEPPKRCKDTEYFQTDATNTTTPIADSKQTRMQNRERTILASQILNPATNTTPPKADIKQTRKQNHANT